MFISYLHYIYIDIYYFLMLKHILCFFRGMHCLEEWMTVRFFVQEFDFDNMCPVRSDIYLSSRL